MFSVVDSYIINVCFESVMKIPLHTAKPFVTSMTIQEPAEKDQNPKLQHAGREMLENSDGSYTRTLVPKLANVEMDLL